MIHRVSLRGGEKKDERKGSTLRLNWIKSLPAVNGTHGVVVVAIGTDGVCGMVIFFIFTAWPVAVCFACWLQVNVLPNVHMALVWPHRPAKPNATATTATMAVTVPRLVGHSFHIN